MTDSVRRDNRFLEAIIENIPNMVFVKDAERLAFVRFNRAGEQLLGMSRDELLGKSDYDFFPKEEADFFQAKDRETLNAGALVDIPEEPIETKHGRRILHTMKVPVLDENGRPLYLLGISEDITERKANEAARARLAAIVNDSADAIMDRTLEGILTSWNRGAERMFGYSAGEMIGHSFRSLIPERFLEEEARLTERILNGETVTSHESVRRRKDGQEIDVSITISPVRAPWGELIGVAHIVRDISELKTMQRQLVRAKEATETANRELEAFSYSVAHDLRAPLRGIDGFSQALLEDYGDKLDDGGRRYVGLVRKSAQRMSQLIEDMLGLSRVSRAALVRRPVDLSALARATLERLDQRPGERQVEVIIAGGLMVHGDARLLSVMLDNLLGNAWKFTGKTPAARIELGASQRPEGRVFFVRDNGAGFDMTYANKLFGVFQRLHDMNEFEGTGVGLATVKRIVERHGGRVWADAAVGRGATFYFTLDESEQDT